MIYRRMGSTGLQLSALSLGSWVTYHNQVDTKAAVEMMAAAFDAGVNFFDNAEGYAGGRSEEVMGAALKALAWPRLNYVVSSKFYWGLPGAGVNGKNTLNRKYLMQAIDGSLQRMGLEHIDIVYCHRPDAQTPVEETARAMSDMITQGKALYWGTSEWPAQAIRAAWDAADRHGWHKPVVEQPQYHLFARRRVEREYKRLYDGLGLGLTTWSPLASGLLTGKYAAGVPDDSRGAMASMAFLREGLTHPATQRRRQATRADRRGTRRHGFSTGAGLGGKQPSRQLRHHGRVEAVAAAVEPGRAGRAGEADAGAAQAHRHADQGSGAVGRGCCRGRPSARQRPD